MNLLFVASIACGNIAGPIWPFMHSKADPLWQQHSPRLRRVPSIEEGEGIHCYLRSAARGGPGLMDAALPLEIQQAVPN
jgi:hypothetical protein